MQKELIDLQPKLKEATIATDALIVQIDKDTIEANAKKALAILLLSPHSFLFFLVLSCFECEAPCVCDLCCAR